MIQDDKKAMIQDDPVFAAIAARRNPLDHRQRVGLME
jgi:hypothetical protein